MIWTLSFFVAILIWDFWVREKEKGLPEGYELKIIGNLKELKKHPAWPKELHKKVLTLAEKPRVEKKLEDAAIRHISEWSGGGIQFIYQKGLWWNSIDKNFIKLSGVNSSWLYAKTLFGSAIKDKRNPLIAVKVKDDELIIYLVYKLGGKEDCRKFGEHKDLDLGGGEKQCLILLAKFPLALLQWYEYGGRKRVELYKMLLNEYDLTSIDTEEDVTVDEEGEHVFTDYYEGFSHHKHKYFIFLDKGIYSENWIQERRKKQFVKKVRSNYAKTK